MKKYKDNNEAAKAYADLLIDDISTEQLKLQHEAATLDFAAGANWKDKQLSLFGVSKQRELLIAAYKYVTNTEERAIELADEFIRDSSNL